MVPASVGWRRCSQLVQEAKQSMLKRRQAALVCGGCQVGTPPHRRRHLEALLLIQQEVAHCYVRKRKPVPTTALAATRAAHRTAAHARAESNKTGLGRILGRGLVRPTNRRLPQRMAACKRRRHMLAAAESIPAAVADGLAGTATACTSCCIVRSRCCQRPLRICIHLAQPLHAAAHACASSFRQLDAAMTKSRRGSPWPASQKSTTASALESADSGDSSTMLPQVVSPCTSHGPQRGTLPPPPPLWLRARPPQPPLSLHARPPQPALRQASLPPEGRPPAGRPTCRAAPGRRPLAACVNAGSAQTGTMHPGRHLECATADAHSSCACHQAANVVAPHLRTPAPEAHPHHMRPAAAVAAVLAAAAAVVLVTAAAAAAAAAAALVAAAAAAALVVAAAVVVVAAAAAAAAAALVAAAAAAACHRAELHPQHKPRHRGMPKRRRSDRATATAASHARRARCLRCKCPGLAGAMRAASRAGCAAAARALPRPCRTTVPCPQLWQWQPP
eukprot:353916-Chlamydomonas_euryale.AAC.5